MDFSRITKNHLIVICWLVIIIAIALFMGKMSLDNIQLSNSINERMNVLSPTLNKQKLNQAVELVGATSSATIKTTPTDDVQPQQLLTKALKIEIINTSGISGAAKSVSDIFPEGSQFDLKNGKKGEVNKEELDESILLYKNEYSDQVESWKKQLGELDWNVGLSKEKTTADAYDVTIVLQR